MTREEAKDYIREWCPYDRQEEIIKALEQKPCDDVVSRQAIKKCKQYIFKTQDMPFPKSNYFIKVDDLMSLPSVKQEPRWIPVDDKLPKNDEDVLVCFPQSGMAVAYYHIDDTYYPTQYADLNETGWFNEEGDAFYFEPIAWMPLPEPYKAEGSDKA